jgi:prepilin-type N-terminal cleavage/methylation domain-containing protein
MSEDKGFTMIEILVAIAIMAIIFALGLFMSMEMYRGYSRRSERDTLASVLERARSRAMANVHQHMWGACLDGSNYVIFSGQNYANRIDSETVPVNSGTTIDASGAPAFLCSGGGIVFAQLTGDTIPATAQTITMTQGAITSTISTNVEGRIDW